MSQSYDAIIIGAGLGGLTAGAVLAAEGQRVLVLEQNAFAGGCATTYQRGPLTIETSLEQTLPPGSPGDPKRELFDRIGGAGDLEFVPAPDFQEVRWRGLGQPFTLPHGLDDATRAMNTRFPAAAKGTNALFEDIRRIHRLPEFAGDTHSVWWKLGHAAELPRDLWAAVRDIRASLSAVLDRTYGGNEAAKIALCANLIYYADDPDQLWWLAFALAQGGFLKSGGSYIKGGSQKLTDHLVRSIQNHGGTLRTRCPATGITLGTDGAVQAVRYTDLTTGQTEIVEASKVLANAAPHAIAQMLPQESTARFMAPYQDRPLSISLLSVTLGLDRPAAEFGMTAYSTVLVPDWIESLADFPKGTALFGQDPAGHLPVICLADYGRIDSGLPADGLHTLSFACADRLENWEGLSEADYAARKEAWLQALIQGIDDAFPGLAGAIRATEMTTARTMHHHLGTPGGATYGFAMIPPKELPRKGPANPETPISGLWLASAYTGFGGFTGAIGGGLIAAKAALAVPSRQSAA